MTKEELIAAALAAYPATLTACAARLAHQLFRLSDDPPDDPVAYSHWKRRRWWMVASELAATPAMAVSTIALGDHFDWSISLIVLLSMGQGALGIGFVLHALETWFRNKAGGK